MLFIFLFYKLAPRAQFVMMLNQNQKTLHEQILVF